MKKTTQLREYLNDQQLHIAPGVFDGLSAKLVEMAGFDCVYASGGAISRSAGYPDLGLLSVTEMRERLAHICDATDLPVIADADTGYGNALNAERTFLQLEQCGIAGAHIEDQTFPKRCGHLNDKSLISCEEMTQKIRVVRQALRDPDFVLIARTDAIAVEGFDTALKRAQAYHEAGADMLFIEAPESVEQIEAIAKQCPFPKLLNMFYGGKTPLVPADQLAAWGYQVVIIPSDLQRAAIHAMQTTLDVIRQQGDSASIKDQLVTFKDRERILCTEAYLKKQ